MLYEVSIHHGKGPSPNTLFCALCHSERDATVVNECRSLYLCKRMSAPAHAQKRVRSEPAGKIVPGAGRFDILASRVRSFRRRQKILNCEGL